MIETLKTWDRELFVFLNNLGIERWDSFWILVTQIETWIPLFILFIVLIFYYYKPKNGALVVLFMVLTFIVTIFFTDLVKDFVARLRPNNVEALNDLIRALQKPTNHSFFSGHASSSFAVTTFVVLSLRKFTNWIFLAYLWPVLFVTSRIYVGVHYPSDILVGALVGTAFAMMGHFLCKRFLLKI
ncbi:phosphatase PAP2 family protein [Ulvibacter antarcticus]|uniref:Undecaprenyl-diphosphatase n=1 Tax=Ulvibacter antarcticus TaxID=442714 RepID=A0A3L9YTG9_9FLAO|nr:phosphatase PAP2 family protein [Ulvibacter antarcticus]RMA57782.1 undecaprenyl-diphosphatase [Ulvibacter antarcticus]